MRSLNTHTHYAGDGAIEQAAGEHGFQIAPEDPLRDQRVIPQGWRERKSGVAGQSLLLLSDRVEQCRSAEGEPLAWRAIGATHSRQIVAAGIEYADRNARWRGEGVAACRAARQAVVRIERRVFLVARKVTAD